MHLRHSLGKLELVLHDFGVFEVLAASFMPQLPQTTLGTLRSNDADDNENVKKTIGLNFARASHIFVHFFPVFARLRRENA